MKRIWQTVYCTIGLIGDATCRRVPSPRTRRHVASPWRIAVLTAFLLIAHCLTLPASASPIVCSSCGYESAEAAAACSHCQATFPTSPEMASVTNVAPPDGFALLAPANLEAEVATGRYYYAKGDVGVAYYFLRNAAALSLITDPATTTYKSSDLVAESERYWDKMTAGGVTCPVCAGTGKTKTSTVTTQGQISAFPRTCTKCRGTGKLERPATVDEIKIAVGEAQRTYAALQRARRSTPLGEAWVPEGWLSHLPGPQIILLRQAVAAPCSYCAGTGRDDCKKCGNNGRVKCSNSKCVNGMVPASSITSGNGSLSRQTKLKCNVCEGAGEILCAQCNGKGTITCKKCDGSGQRDVCKTCHGLGEADCKKCHGSGQWKGADCVSCKQTGRTICPSCSGDGRKGM